MAFGFDFSAWQHPDSWDWPGVSASASLMIGRASYGRGTKDKYFQTYAQRVRDTGKPFGAYHFYRQKQSWQEQLDVYMGQLGSVSYGAGDLFPALDLENNVSNGDGNPLKSKFNVDARLIAEALRSEFGGCILYMSAYFPEWMGAKAGGGDSGDWKWILEDGYFNWLADYNRAGGNPRCPYTPDWVLHQAKPAKHALYAKASTVVDHDYVRDGVDVASLLIPEQETPGGDTTEGDEHTNERPGGALPTDWEDAWGMIREGAAMIAEGAVLMERARDDDG